MKKKKTVIIIIAMLVIIFITSLVISKNNENTIRKRNISKVDYKFTLNFIKEVDKNRKDNYLVSPYSVEIALNMLRDGTSGDSKKQIEDALGNRVINNLSVNKNIKIANGLFVKDLYKKDISNKYVKGLKNDYSADVIYDEFKTPKVINDWVNNKTDKMIPVLLDQVDSNFVLAIVNALAINEEWENSFECEKTIKDTFTKKDGSTIKVAMMNGTNNGTYFETDNAKGVVLPYKSKNEKEGLEFIAILPNDIDSYINNLNEKELKAIDSYKGNSESELRIALPKFSYEYDLQDFMKVLQSMGIKDVFNPGAANLSAMFKKDNDFYVSEAIHKTHIELDEKGTKAAASTAFVISKNDAAGDYVSIRFDKPFVYIIRDKKTKEILFFGKVLEPNKWEGNKCNG